MKHTHLFLFNGDGLFVFIKSLCHLTFFLPKDYLQAKLGGDRIKTWEKGLDHPNLPP